MQNIHEKYVRNFKYRFMIEQAMENKTNKTNVTVGG